MNLKSEVIYNQVPIHAHLMYTIFKFYFHESHHSDFECGLISTPHFLVDLTLPLPTPHVQWFCSHVAHINDAIRSQCTNIYGQNIHSQNIFDKISSTKYQQNELSIVKISKKLTIDASKNTYTIISN